MDHGNYFRIINCREFQRHCVCKVCWYNEMIMIVSWGITVKNFIHAAHYYWMVLDLYRIMSMYVYLKQQLQGMFLVKKYQTQR